MKVQDILTENQEPKGWLYQTKDNHIALVPDADDEFILPFIHSAKHTKGVTGPEQWIDPKGSCLYPVDNTSHTNSLNNLVHHILDNLVSGEYKTNDDEFYVALGDIVDEVVQDLKRGKRIDADAKVDPLHDLFDPGDDQPDWWYDHTTGKNM